MDQNEFAQKVEDFMALDVPSGHDFNSIYAAACCINLMREHKELTYKFLRVADGETFAWTSCGWEELADIFDEQEFIDILRAGAERFPDMKLEPFVELAENVYLSPRNGSEPKLKPWYVGYELGDYPDWS